MCLGTKLSNRSLARYKAKGKKTGYIRVWKTVEDNGQKFRPDFNPEYNYKLYATGLNKAQGGAFSEQELIHAFRDRASAQKWASSADTIVVSALVHPDWIKAIGKTYNKKLTLTTKAIVMPEYPKRRVTVREFRAAIKGKKVKVYVWEK
ncbi:hypothetical protein LCGC14_1601730 [marine sediment metagenome]|uniref:Uncharacterized protein n=1 Tax=marine sediment metagenome TaxID=412755 RepID=A0A0F9KRK5_9ZZZZ